MVTPADLIGAAHDIASVKVLVPLYRLQRVLRASHRPALRAFQEGLNFRRNVQEWSVDQKRGWILDRLRYTVRRAASETAYYRELFKRLGFEPEADFGFEDFARLPVLQREDIERGAWTLVSDSVPRDQLRADATGGSTGKPTEIWMGPEERGWRESGLEYFMERVGASVGTRTAYLWGHHLDPVASDRFLDRLRDFVANVRWFDCFRLSAPVLEGYHREMSRWQPGCVVAYASALADLASVAEDLPERPNYPTRCFVTGAEKLLAHQREVIQRVFGQPVFERYGSRDVGLIGFQIDAPRDHCFEVDWVNIMVEPEAPTRESSILVTKLHADGMPMLRYRIGDVGRFDPDSRPGHPCFMLPEVLGREADRIALPGGGWIHGLEFPHLMKDYPIRDFQLVQHKDLSVVLFVVPKEGFTEEDRRAILRVMLANLRGVDVTLKLVTRVLRSASNKWRPVRSEVNDCTGAQLQ